MAGTLIVWNGSADGKGTGRLQESDVLCGTSPGGVTPRTHSPTMAAGIRTLRQSGTVAARRAEVTAKAVPSRGDRGYCRGVDRHAGEAGTHPGARA